MLGFSPLASTAIADDGGIASISIQANDIVCAAPTVENSVIGQTHNLSSTEITAGAPQVAPTSVTQGHNLAASDIASGVPVVENTNASILYAVLANDILSGVPTVGTTDIDDIYNLQANDIVSAAPIVDQVQFRALQNLLANGILSGTPIVDAVSLTEVNNFSAVNITTTPVVDSAIMGQIYVFLASDIRAGSAAIETNFPEDTVRKYHSTLSQTQTQVSVVRQQDRCTLKLAKNVESEVYSDALSFNCTVDIDFYASPKIEKIAVAFR